jgi:hypothetical protein
MSAVFKNMRFATKGIARVLPMDVQCVMWAMIDALDQDLGVDYLQVFDLSEDDGLQRISHSQEKPPYRYDVLVMGVKPIEGKVFVIDSDEYSTMLFAEEY